MLPGPPGSVTRVVVSGSQTEPFLCDLPPMPLPLSTYCSASASREASCSQAQPSISAKRKLGEKKGRGQGCLFPRRMCAQMWTDQKAPDSWECELAGPTPHCDRPEAWISILDRWVSKHLERQVIVIRSQHVAFPSPHGKAVMPGYFHFLFGHAITFWSLVLPCLLGLAQLLPNSDGDFVNTTRVRSWSSDLCLSTADGHQRRRPGPGLGPAQALQQRCHASCCCQCHIVISVLNNWKYIPSCSVSGPGSLPLLAPSSLVPTI